MEDNIVVINSDSDDDECNIYAKAAKFKCYKELWLAANEIVFHHLSSNDKLTFPYIKFQQFFKYFKKTLNEIHLESTKTFIWQNLIQWLLAMKLSYKGIADLKYDEKFNLILIDFMAEYIDYKCKSNAKLKDEIEIHKKINEIIGTLGIIFNNNSFFIVMALLKIDVNDDYAKILNPIFNKYLSDKFAHKPNELISYLQLILCYKQWKKLSHFKKDKELINEIAVGTALKLLNNKNESNNEITGGILPKFVPIVNDNNRSFTTISDLINYAIKKRNIGTRILLINKSLDLSEAIEKYFQQYERYINRCDPHLSLCISAKNLSLNDNAIIEISDDCDGIYGKHKDVAAAKTINTKYLQQNQQKNTHNSATLPLSAPNKNQHFSLYCDISEKTYKKNFFDSKSIKLVNNLLYNSDKDKTNRNRNCVSKRINQNCDHIQNILEIDISDNSSNENEETNNVNDVQRSFNKIKKSLPYKTFQQQQQNEQQKSKITTSYIKNPQVTTICLSSSSDEDDEHIVDDRSTVNTNRFNINNNNISDRCNSRQSSVPSESESELESEISVNLKSGNTLENIDTKQNVQDFLRNTDDAKTLSVQHDSENIEKNPEKSSKAKEIPIEDKSSNNEKISDNNINQQIEHCLNSNFNKKENSTVSSKKPEKQRCIPGEVSSTTLLDYSISDNEMAAASTSSSLEIHSSGGFESSQYIREVGNIIKVNTFSNHNRSFSKNNKPENYSDISSDEDEFSIKRNLCARFPKYINEIEKAISSTTELNHFTTINKNQTNAESSDDTQKYRLSKPSRASESDRVQFSFYNSLCTRKTNNPVNKITTSELSIQNLTEKHPTNVAALPPVSSSNIKTSDNNAVLCAANILLKNKNTTNVLLRPSKISSEFRCENISKNCPNNYGKNCRNESDDAATKNESFVNETFNKNEEISENVKVLSDIKPNDPSNEKLLQHFQQLKLNETVQRINNTIEIINNLAAKDISPNYKPETETDNSELTNTSNSKIPEIINNSLILEENVSESKLEPENIHKMSGKVECKQSTKEDIPKENHTQIIGQKVSTNMNDELSIGKLLRSQSSQSDYVENKILTQTPPELECANSISDEIVAETKVEESLIIDKVLTNAMHSYKKTNTTTERNEMLTGSKCIEENVIADSRNIQSEPQHINKSLENFMTNIQTDENQIKNTDEIVSNIQKELEHQLENIQVELEHDETKLNAPISKDALSSTKNNVELSTAEIKNLENFVESPLEETELKIIKSKNEKNAILNKMEVKTINEKISTDDSQEIGVKKFNYILNAENVENELLIYPEIPRATEITYEMLEDVVALPSEPEKEKFFNRRQFEEINVEFTPEKWKEYKMSIQDKDDTSSISEDSYFILTTKKPLQQCSLKFAEKNIKNITEKEHDVKDNVQCETDTSESSENLTKESIRKNPNKKSSTIRLSSPKETNAKQNDKPLKTYSKKSTFIKKVYKIFDENNTMCKKYSKNSTTIKIVKQELKNASNIEDILKKPLRTFSKNKFNNVTKKFDVDMTKKLNNFNMNIDIKNDRTNDDLCNLTGNENIFENCAKTEKKLPKKLINKIENVTVNTELLKKNSENVEVKNNFCNTENIAFENTNEILDNGQKQTPKITLEMLEEILEQPSTPDKNPDHRISKLDYEKTPFKLRFKRRLSQCFNMDDIFDSNFLQRDVIENNDRINLNVNGIQNSSVFENSENCFENEKAISENNCHQESWMKKLGLAKSNSETINSEEKEPLDLSGQKLGGRRKKSNCVKKFPAEDQSWINQNANEISQLATNAQLNNKENLLRNNLNLLLEAAELVCHEKIDDSTSTDEICRKTKKKSRQNKSHASPLSNIRRSTSQSDREDTEMLFPTKSMIRNPNQPRGQNKKRVRFLTPNSNKIVCPEKSVVHFDVKNKKVSALKPDKVTKNIKKRCTFDSKTLCIDSKKSQNCLKKSDDLASKSKTDLMSASNSPLLNSSDSDDSGKLVIDLPEIKKRRAKLKTSKEKRGHVSKNLANSKNVELYTPTKCDMKNLILEPPIINFDKGLLMATSQMCPNVQENVITKTEKTKNSKQTIVDPFAYLKKRPEITIRPSTCENENEVNSPDPSDDYCVMYPIIELCESDEILTIDSKNNLVSCRIKPLKKGIKSKTIKNSKARKELPDKKKTLEIICSNLKKQKDFISNEEFNYVTINKKAAETLKNNTIISDENLSSNLKEIIKQDQSKNLKLRNVTNFVDSKSEGLTRTTNLTFNCIENNQLVDKYEAFLEKSINKKVEESSNGIHGAMNPIVENVPNEKSDSLELNSEHASDFEQKNENEIDPCEMFEQIKITGTNITDGRFLGSIEKEQICKKTMPEKPLGIIGCANSNAQREITEKIDQIGEKIINKISVTDKIEFKTLDSSTIANVQGGENIKTDHLEEMNNLEKNIKTEQIIALKQTQEIILNELTVNHIIETLPKENPMVPENLSEKIQQQETDPSNTLKIKFNSIVDDNEKPQPTDETASLKCSELLNKSKSHFRENASETRTVNPENKVVDDIIPPTLILVKIEESLKIDLLEKNNTISNEEKINFATVPTKDGETIKSEIKCKDIQIIKSVNLESNDSLHEAKGAIQEKSQIVCSQNNNELCELKVGNEAIEKKPAILNILTGRQDIKSTLSKNINAETQSNVKVHKQIFFSKEFRTPKSIIINGFTVNLTKKVDCESSILPEKIIMSLDLKNQLKKNEKISKEHLKTSIPNQKQKCIKTTQKLQLESNSNNKDLENASQASSKLLPDQTIEFIEDSINNQKDASRAEQKNLSLNSSQLVGSNVESNTKTVSKNTHPDIEETENLINSELCYSENQSSFESKNNFDVRDTGQALQKLSSMIMNLEEIVDMNEGNSAVNESMLKKINTFQSLDKSSSPNKASFPTSFPFYNIPENIFNSSDSNSSEDNKISLGLNISPAISRITEKNGGAKRKIRSYMSVNKKQKIYCDERLKKLASTEKCYVQLIRQEYIEIMCSKLINNPDRQIIKTYDSDNESTTSVISSSEDIQSTILNVKMQLDNLKDLRFSSSTNQLIAEPQPVKIPQITDVGAPVLKNAVEYINFDTRLTSLDFSSSEWCSEIMLDSINKDLIANHDYASTKKISDYMLSGELPENSLDLREVLCPLIENEMTKLVPLESDTDIVHMNTSVTSMNQAVNMNLILDEFPMRSKQQQQSHSHAQRSNGNIEISDQLLNYLDTVNPLNSDYFFDQIDENPNYTFSTDVGFDFQTNGTDSSLYDLELLIENNSEILSIDDNGDTKNDDKKNTSFDKCYEKVKMMHSTPKKQQIAPSIETIHVNTLSRELNEKIMIKNNLKTEKVSNDCTFLRKTNSDQNSLQHQEIFNCLEVQKINSPELQKFSTVNTIVNEKNQSLKIKNDSNEKFPAYQELKDDVLNVKNSMIPEEILNDNTTDSKKTSSILNRRKSTNEMKLIILEKTPEKCNITSESSSSSSGSKLKSYPTPSWKVKNKSSMKQANMSSDIQNKYTNDITIHSSDSSNKNSLEIVEGLKISSSPSSSTNSSTPFKSSGLFHMPVLELPSMKPASSNAIIKRAKPLIKSPNVTSLPKNLPQFNVGIVSGSTLTKPKIVVDLLNVGKRTEKTHTKRGCTSTIDSELPAKRKTSENKSDAQSIFDKLKNEPPVNDVQIKLDKNKSYQITSPSNEYKSLIKSTTNPILIFQKTENDNKNSKSERSISNTSSTVHITKSPMLCDDNLKLLPDTKKSSNQNSIIQKNHISYVKKTPIYNQSPTTSNSSLDIPAKPNISPLPYKNAKSHSCIPLQTSAIQSNRTPNEISISNIEHKLTPLLKANYHKNVVFKDQIFVKQSPTVKTPEINGSPATNNVCDNRTNKVTNPYKTNVSQYQQQQSPLPSTNHVGNSVEELKTHLDKLPMPKTYGEHKYRQQIVKRLEEAKIKRQFELEEKILSAKKEQHRLEQRKQYYHQKQLIQQQKQKDLLQKQKGQNQDNNKSSSQIQQQMKPKPKYINLFSRLSETTHKSLNKLTEDKTSDQLYNKTHVQPLTVPTEWEYRDVNCDEIIAVLRNQKR